MSAARVLIAIALGAVLCHSARADDFATTLRLPELRVASIASSCAVGVATELADSARRQQPATEGEAALACLTGLVGITTPKHLSIRRIPGGAEVLYRIAL